MENLTLILFPIDFARPFYLNLTMFIFGLLIALINGVLLIRMKTAQYLQKAKRYVFLANMTFCDFCSGFALIGLAIANVFGGDGPLVCLLQGETCLNLCLTMSCYSCSIVIQFIAVRYPIYYRISVTKAKIGLVVAMCWVYAVCFSGMKLVYVMAITHGSSKAENYYIFPFVDIVLKFVSLIGNCSGWAYVMIVAVTRRRQQVPKTERKGPGRQSTSKEFLDCESLRSLKSNRESTGALKRCSDCEHRRGALAEDQFNEIGLLRKKKPTVVSYIHQYESILTSGLRLVVYITTSLPLIIYCTYVLSTKGKNAINPGKVYGDSRDIGVSLVLLWFCRALADPFITLAREKPMKTKKATASLSSGTITVSVSSSQVSKTNSISAQADINA